MGDNSSHFSFERKSPLYQLIVSLLIILVAGLFLFNILVLAGTLIFNGDFRSSPENILNEAGENDLKFLRYLLISQDISLFIFPAIIILNLMNSGHQVRLMNMRIPLIKELVLVIVLALCLFPITDFTGKLNSAMHLPDWLSGVEKWMINKEDFATRLIDSLMAANTFWVMILNVFVIAVMPAIGEELIFRGVFQKLFTNLFKSGILAIWVTAFLFSAVHFQFFGFVPRMILGLVFGYLYLWGRTLWLPVISHFVNNAVPVIGSYILGWEKISAPSDISSCKQMIVLPLPIIICLVILLYFRNKSKKDKEIIENQTLLANS